MRLVPILLIAALAAAAGAGGYALWQRPRAAAPHDHHGEEQAGAVKYTCPMHPFIVTDKPGGCPICGMTLVKQAAAPPASAAPTADGQLSMTAGQQVTANVATAKVDRRALVKEIAAVGIVQYDQSRQGKVTAWVAGRIDRLLVNTVGAAVSKGRPVAELYSPDLVSAQQEYLLALRSRDQLKSSPVTAIAQGGDGLVTSARQRLKLLGVRDEQIAALERSGQPHLRLAVYTPLSGVVIDKLVQEGQYVNAGDPLFNVADLSRVWVELELYESDLAAVRVGQPVQLTTPSYPAAPFSGRVSFVYPFLDPKTRTVKVRVELANTGLRLKPDMFVNATVRIPLEPSLVVPVTAVQDTGARAVVWVESRPGLFEPREVRTGARSGELVQVLSGLTRGDRVAVNGGYLIDSESQMRGGIPTGPKQPAAGQATSPGAAPATAPRKGGELNMDDMKM